MSTRARWAAGAAWLLVLLVVTGSGSGAWAEEVLHLDGTGRADAEVRAGASTPDVIEVTLELHGVAWEPVTTPAGAFTRLRLGDEGFTGEEGHPALPVVGRLLEIPFGAQVNVEVTAERHTDHALAELGGGARLYPIQPPRRRDVPADQYPFVYDASAYARTDWTPEALATVRRAGQMRGRELAFLEIRPFAYQPAAGVLRTYEQVTVRVRLAGGDPAAAAAEAARVRSVPFEHRFRQLILNDGAYAGNLLEFPSLPIGMLIITAPAYESGLATFADWKRAKGYEVTVVNTTATGTTAAQIAAYIATAYNTWPVPPTYVLLVGDTDAIPAFTGSAAGTETDLYFVTVGTGDYFPEMSVGRFPVRTSAQLATMVEKTVDLETLAIPSTAWLNKICFIAASDLGGFAEQTHQWVIDNYLDPAGITYDKIYQRLGGSTADITNSVNGGVTIVDYSGHGSETGWSSVPFNNSNVNALSNVDKYPFVVSNACLTGSYADAECFMEAWVRAANKGAVADWGASNYTYWDEDDILEKRMFKAMFEEDFYAVGGFTDQAKYELWQYYSGGGRSRYYYEAYNVMGDPSLELFVGTPDPMTAEYPEGLPVGMDEISVSVTDPGGALDHALCSVVYGGAALGSAYTDESGQAVVHMDPAPTVPGTYQLNVTRPWHLPHFGSFEMIASTGPCLVLQSCLVDDDRRGLSRGNNDRGADAGETLELTLTIKNTGGVGAPAVTATLRTSDPYATLTDSLKSYGDIPPLGSATSPSAYVLAVSPACPDLHELTLTCQIDSGDSTWTYDLDFTVEAPVLEVVGYVVDDTAGGDGDGTAEPGETVALSLKVANQGHEDAFMVVSELHTLTPDLTVLAATSGSASILAGTTATLEPAASISVSPGATTCALAPLQSELRGSYSYHAYRTFGLRVGGFYDEIETGAPGWTHGPVTTGKLDQWHVSTELDHTTGSGHSWKQGSTGTGDYGNNCDGGLVTPVVTLGAGTHLTFWHWMEAELSTGGYAYDGGIVEMKLGAGSWQQITPVGGYPYLLESGTTLPAGTPCYSGAFGWTQADFDLSAYGGTAQFRFRFVSDVSTTAEGWYVDDVLVIGGGTSGTEVAGGETPAVQEGSRELALLPNRPNPFNPQTAIGFVLPARGPASLAVFDVSGRLVRTLVDRTVEAGKHEVTWDGRDEQGQAVSSGVYFYRLEAAGQTLSQSMVLLK